MTVQSLTSLMVPELTKSLRTKKENPFLAPFTAAIFNFNDFSEAARNFDFKNNTSDILEIMISGLLRNQIGERTSTTTAFANKNRALILLSELVKEQSLSVNWETVLTNIEPYVRKSLGVSRPATGDVLHLVNTAVGPNDVRKNAHAAGMCLQHEIPIYLLIGLFEGFDINKTKTTDGVNLFMMVMAAENTTVELIQNLVEMGADIHEESPVHGPVYRFLNIPNGLGLAGVSVNQDRSNMSRKLDYLLDFNAPIFERFVAKSYHAEEIKSSGVLGIGDTFDSFKHEYEMVKLAASGIVNEVKADYLDGLIAAYESNYLSMRKVSDIVSTERVKAVL